MLVVALITLPAGILALGAATLAGTAHASRATEPSYPKPTIVPYPGAPAGDVDLYLKHDTFLTSFASGVPRRQAENLYPSQRPLTLSAGFTPSGPPAWATIPSWYVLGTKDLIITPDAQNFMATRAHSTITRIPTGHLGLITDPDAITKVIKTAVRATR